MLTLVHTIIIRIENNMIRIENNMIRIENNMIRIENNMIRIENNMIRDLPEQYSIIMGSTSQDTEDSVVDPSLLTRSFS
jgi:hypothetical protein